MKIKTVSAVSADVGNLSYSAEIIFKGSIASAFRALASPQAVSTWNPAITAVSAKQEEVACSGDSYRMKIRGLISTKLTYVLVSPERIEYRLESAGNIEIGNWSLTQLSNSKALVQHRFEHHGRLLKLMRGAFAPVAMWRIERLAYLAQLNSTPPNHKTSNSRQ